MSFTVPLASVLSYRRGVGYRAEGQQRNGHGIMLDGPIRTLPPKADMLGARAFQEANLMKPQGVAEAAYKALFAGDRCHYSWDYKQGAGLHATSHS